jgi:aspartate racemase
MGEWSAYRSIADQVRVETPANSHSLHQLIHDVKRVGSSDPAHRRRFESLLSEMRADTVLLACTELPLLGEVETDKTLVDVTDLVAFELATRSLEYRGNAG